MPSTNQHDGRSLSDDIGYIVGIAILQTGMLPNLPLWNRSRVAQGSLTPGRPDYGYYGIKSGPCGAARAGRVA